MTVEELLNELSELPPCASVKIASQPQWPFEYSLQGVYVLEPGTHDDDDEPACEEPTSSLHADDASDEPTIVYLAEGPQLGYLPRTARRLIGW